jgi:hypothetical protein
LHHHQAQLQSSKAYKATIACNHHQNNHNTHNLPNASCCQHRCSGRFQVRSPIHSTLAQQILTTPRVLPVVLAVGGATVAGGLARSQQRLNQFNAAQNKTLAAPDAKFVNVVLESIFA